MLIAVPALNGVASLSVRVAEPGAQRGHRHEEGCDNQRRVRVHETAAPGAGRMGKIHPGVL